MTFHHCGKMVEDHKMISSELLDSKPLALHRMLIASVYLL